MIFEWYVINIYINRHAITIYELLPEIVGLPLTYF